MGLGLKGMRALPNVGVSRLVNPCTTRTATPEPGPCACPKEVAANTGGVGVDSTSPTSPLGLDLVTECVHSVLIGK